MAALRASKAVLLALVLAAAASRAHGEASVRAARPCDLAPRPLETRPRLSSRSGGQHASMSRRRNASLPCRSPPLALDGKGVHGGL